MGLIRVVSLLRWATSISKPAQSGFHTNKIWVSLIGSNKFLVFLFFTNLILFNYYLICFRQLIFYFILT